jgi:ATP-dependent Clp protease ATP-binding subunit ClpC
MGTPPPVKQTPRVEQTVRRAELIAMEYGHDYIGTEHLLLALAADPDGIAGRVLEELGVRDQAERRVRSIIESPEYSA